MYAEGESCEVEARRETTTQTVDRKIQEAERNLAQLSELKELLKRNPDFERMTSILGTRVLR